MWFLHDYHIIHSNMGHDRRASHIGYAKKTKSSPLPGNPALGFYTSVKNHYKYELQREWNGKKREGGNKAYFILQIRSLFRSTRKMKCVKPI